MNLMMQGGCARHNRAPGWQAAWMAGPATLLILLLAVGLAPGLAAAQPAVLSDEPPPMPAEPPPPPEEGDPSHLLPPPPPMMDPAGDDRPLWETLDEFYPEQSRHLRMLRDKDPGEFARRAGQMRPWLRDLRDARERNPELARALVEKHETEMAIRDWQRRYQQAQPEQKEALAAEGKKLAQRRVTQRLEHARLEIQMMEKRLADLKARVRDREENKDAAVERELSTMKNPPASQPSHRQGRWPRPPGGPRPEPGGFMPPPEP